MIAKRRIILARLTLVPFLLCSVPLILTFSIISSMNLLVKALESPLFWYIRHAFGRNHSSYESKCWYACVNCLMWYATSPKSEIKSCENAWRLLRNQRGEK